MFVSATVALDPQKAVLQQTALQVNLKLLADEAWQVTAGSLDLLNKTRVMFVNSGIQDGPLGTMALVSRAGDKYGRWVQ